MASDNELGRLCPLLSGPPPFILLLIVSVCFFLQPHVLNKMPLAGSPSRWRLPCPM
ncbi:rCG55827, isoform CRA_b [Rattus norvegicus]|uniref:RCG55827, isoform CRA_b n=1 Tax=Rattus norvegicus TaxID=10116 RepID=A6JLW8_RAT|nr:rCG55827, isoform CRA_b [Rattus norvegicus]